MAEAELCKVESANKALDRSDRIVRPDIVLNPGRKQTGLLPALAGLECAIRPKPNRTSTPENAPHSCPASPGKSLTRLSFACPALFAKIFWFSEDPNHFYIRRRAVPQEGRLAIVTDAGRDVVDARRPADEALLGRTAKSRGPDASTPASSWQ